MVQRINRLIILLGFVALSLYVVILNRDPISVELPFYGGVTTMGGVVLIGTFIVGFVAAVIIALVFGIRSWWREQRLLGKERQRQTFYAGLMEARSALACHEWVRARDKWQQIVRKDPTDIIARVELSRSLAGDGDLRGALAVVDEARAADPKNIEVLFRTAELHLELHNRTAALDALRLILSQRSIPRALTMARSVAEELGEFEQAIEFHDQITRLGGDETEIHIAAAKLECGKASRDAGNDKLALLDALKGVAKRFSDDVAVLERVGNLALELGRTEEATQFLTKAARSSGSAHHWRAVANAWLRAKTPDRALAAARAGCKETKGNARVEAELFLGKLLLNLNMIEDAQQSIASLPALVREQGVKLTKEQSYQLLLLRGQCYHRTGDSRSMTNLWQELGEQEASSEGRLAAQTTSSRASNGEQPSPTLSTP
jgi:tetratricopeptide (TPR) repeat protein